MNEKRVRKIKSFALALLYSVSLSCGLSSSCKRNSDEKGSRELFFGNRKEVIEEYNRDDSSYLAYIVDERSSVDPNIKVYKSCLINDRETIKYIINELLEYEKNNPSDWDRSFDSMYKEWIIHNICYDFFIKRFNTESVDLNNDDEIDYLENNFLSLILKEHN